MNYLFEDWKKTVKRIKESEDYRYDDIEDSPIDILKQLCESGRITVQERDYGIKLLT